MMVSATKVTHESAHLFALCFRKQTELLGLLIFAVVAHKTPKYLFERVVYSHGLTFAAFGIETWVEKHG